LALLRAKHLRSVLRTVLVVAPIIMVGAPQFFAARRGPTIAWALLILGCYGFSGKSRFRFIVTVVALAFTGLLAVSLLAMRSELEEGTGFFQALRNIEHKDVVSDRTEQVPDNEYAYHCGLVGTVYQTGFYQYGTKTLMLLAHWVPRKYWPGKPGRGQGLFSDIAQDAMPTTVSIDMGPSMSAAGFAHAFEDFGFFCVLFWFLFGLVCAKIYMRALYSHSYLWQAAWLNILSAAHWLIAQDFGAFFVPMMLAQGAMLAFWFLVTQATGTGAPNPRARRRRRIMANPKGIPPQSPGL
jgi:hypothetical protein